MKPKRFKVRVESVEYKLIIANNGDTARNLVSSGFGADGGIGEEDYDIAEESEITDAEAEGLVCPECAVLWTEHEEACYQVGPPPITQFEANDPAEAADMRAEWEGKPNVLDDNEPTGPFWRCEESACGYESYTLPMPKDRAKFYKRVDEHGSPKCPKCKSESFMPVGF